MAITRRLKEVLLYRYVLKIDSIAKTVKMYNSCLQHHHQYPPLHLYLLIVASSLNHSHPLSSTTSYRDSLLLLETPGSNLFLALFLVYVRPTGIVRLF